MVEVSLAQLEADFPGLLETARRGEDVVIVSNGEPVARLDPLPELVHMPPWDPTTQSFADRVAEVRTKFALNAPPMSEAEIQAEWDDLRGRS